MPPSPPPLRLSHLPESQQKPLAPAPAPAYVKAAQAEGRPEDRTVREHLGTIADKAGRRKGDDHRE